jgi:WD40 repeat protein
VPGSQEENIYTPQILSTYFNKFANNGQGNVIYKNRTLLQGDLGQQVPAVKHGNGKDWWLLIQSRNTNCFYPVLLTDTGLQVMASQTCGGQPVGDTDITSVAFSPDGSKFAHFAVYGGLNIYNFDRCTGELSSPIYYPLDIAKDSSWLGNGIAFSPNSRFLYVSATKIVLQFDMWASNILASIDTVAVYDGFKFPLGSYFDEAQLGPDGKIYISCGNSELDYHVIKNPDGKGDSCSFAQHSILLTSPSVCVPYFPNYRLGALTGSACDTITGLNEVARAAKEQILKVFPNPATDITTVDYGFTDWNKTQPNLEICNTLGQTVYSQVLPMYSGFQKIDVSRFADGMYTVFIKRDNVVVATQKLVKQ